MNYSRRSWFGAAALSAASYQRVVGANSRIRVGLIGSGGRGSYVAELFAQSGQAEIVAICDVYAPNLERAKQRLNPSAESYVDYKDLLARQDIQAVLIGSPDHWHVPMTMDAVAAGKDVYVEKPLTHNTEEGAKLVAFMKGRKERVQVGYQQRNTPTFEEVKEMVGGGKFGDINLVQASWHSGQYGAVTRMQEFDFRQDRLDWERWLGPAPQRPVDKLRFRVWRYFWDYGGGSVTDLMSHWVDAIHWLLGDDTPTHVAAFGENSVTPELDCPDAITASLVYPKRFLLSYRNSVFGGNDAYGIAFHGSEGWALFNRQRLEVWFRDQKNRNQPAISMRNIDGTPYHVLDFLNCIRTREMPRSDVESAVKSANVGHRTNQCIRTKQVSAI